MTREKTPSADSAGAPVLLRLQRVLHALSRGLAVVSAIAGGLMALPIIYSVFMRYVLNTPVRWTEELVGLVTISLVFLPLPYLAITNRHISVTLVVHSLPASLQVVATRAAAALTLLFGIVFAYLSFDFMWVSFKFGARSMLADLLLFPWMAVIPFSCFVWGCVSALQLVTGATQSASEDPLSV